ncbi:MAG TPA: DUF4197 domain-containing protein [Edaphocola sp.]|nr:DUF4197 domain-containing protein [Edaphocola sp.]
MKKIILSFTAMAMLTGASLNGEAQTLKNILNTLQGSNNSQSGSLTNSQVVSGLKEALRIGANNAANKLSETDGFFRNAAVKILMPPEVAQVEKTLRSVGMGSIVDKAILSMNRAAEDAAKKAAPIFVDAITSMTLEDGFSILNGGQNAATNFLRGKTSAALSSAFRPVVQQSLEKVGATAMWKTVFTTYNKLPLVAKKVNPDLSSYVVERALDGMFYSIAQEELKIRTDPAAQVTNLLKQVFGNKK